MNHQVLEKNDKTAFRGADGEQQVDHPDDRLVTTQNENPTAIRLLEDQTQAAQLFVFVRTKVALFTKEFTEEAGEFVQVFCDGWLDHHIVHRDGYSIFPWRWQLAFTSWIESVETDACPAPR